MHSHVAVTVALVVLAISSIASAHDEYKALVSTGNVVPITLANSSALLSWTFSEQVSHTGWLVVMPGASVDEKAITGAARYLQYVAAVATVPEDSATVDLVDALGGPVKDEAYFRVFSFSRGLSTEHKSFTDIISARSFLLESAPPVYIPLNEENSQQFLSAAVMQHRIAILFFTESTKFHALAARLAYRFQEHTLVGVAAKPSESLLTSLKVDSVPQVRFMSAQMPKTAEDTAKGVQFQGAPYSDAQFGKANYANTVRWIKMVINAHNEVNFFAESAQSDSSHDQNEPQTPEQPTEFQSAETVVLNNEQIGSVCSETALGMCVIAFVSSDIDQYKLIMEKVRTSFSQSSRPLHFALVDLTCDYAPAKRVFGIEPDQSPALIVLSRSKGKMARFVGSFTADAIDGFLSRVHLGREAMMALSDAGWLADGDLMSADACASLHGEIAALEAESAAAASSDDDEEYMTEKEKREKRAREEKEKKKKKKKKGNKKKKAKKTKKKTVEETEPKQDL